MAPPLATCKLQFGVVVPMPTRPAAVTSKYESPVDVDTEKILFESSTVPTWSVLVAWAFSMTKALWELVLVLILWVPTTERVAEGEEVPRPRFPELEIVRAAG